MIINGVKVTTESEFLEAIKGMDDASKMMLSNMFYNIDPKARDLEKYKKRAAVKDNLIAQMASENMERVRSGIWTVSDLISLTQHPGIAAVLNDMSSLSFELAQGKIQAINHPVITQEIKDHWCATLQAHLYNS